MLKIALTHTRHRSSNNALALRVVPFWWENISACWCQYKVANGAIYMSITKHNNKLKKFHDTVYKLETMVLICIWHHGFINKATNGQAHYENKRRNTSRSSEPQGALVRRVCRSYSRKKSLMRSLAGYKDEHSLKRNLNTFFPSSK